MPGQLTAAQPSLKTALDLKLEDGQFDSLSLSAVDTDDSEATLKFYCQLGSSDVNQPEWQFSKCRYL